MYPYFFCFEFSEILSKYLLIIFHFIFKILNIEKHGKKFYKPQGETKLFYLVKHPDQVTFSKRYKILSSTLEYN